MEQPAPQAAKHLVAIRDLVKHNDWDGVLRFTPELPRPVQSAWLPLADEIAFAHGRVRRHRDAIEIASEAIAIERTWRRASSLAYLHYDAAMCGGKGVPKGARPLSREEAREGFRAWMALALELRPNSIKDLYRLGVFEAQVESRHDKAALRAFLAAIAAYRALSDGDREKRGDLHRAYIKSFHAGARSALRLGRVPLARRLAFACIREDGGKDRVAPIHRYDMAGRACFAADELDHAERAFRLALDAKGPPRRDYLYARLSDVALCRGDYAEACRWIEAHVRPERRAAWLWRRLGDAQEAAGLFDEALASWQASIAKDRGGKHLTWTRIADVHAARGAYRRAERTYRKAIDFARRRWSKDHRPAIEALAKLYRKRGKEELADKVLAPLAKARPPLPPMPTEQELEA